MTQKRATHFSSLDARGNSLFFFRSVLAIMATNSPFSFTIGSLPEGTTKGYGFKSTGQFQQPSLTKRTRCQASHRSRQRAHFLSFLTIHTFTEGTRSSNDAPFLLFCRISFASSSVTPCGATIKSSSFVITCIIEIPKIACIKILQR